MPSISTIFAPVRLLPRMVTTAVGLAVVGVKLAIAGFSA
jgi:hypothetical protein